ncbi:MAG: sulfurtransferase [Magnetococcales bacterium]|nr:sulfurtransferase [Magnetococcales bacterium]
MQLPGRFIDTEWLYTRLSGDVHADTGQLLLLQAGGESYYEQAHLPEALLLRYAEIITMRDGVPGMRADHDSLIQLFGSLGLDGRHDVVVYDGAGGTDACRVAWTLATLGQDNVAVLDGGITQWYQEKRPLESGMIQPVVQTFAPVATENGMDWAIDWQGVLEIVEGHRSALLLDVRSEKEYLGINLTGPRGHIPGAIHLDWMDTLINRNSTLLKPVAELQQLFACAGLTDLDQPVVVYCQTGHRASQTWLLLRHIGCSRVQLYDGSMAEWGHHNLPVWRDD